MAHLAPNRIAWTYTDNNGNDWRVSAMKAYTDQAVQGGAAAAASLPGKPRGLRMRGVYMTDAAGHTRLVPSYDETSDLWTDSATTMNLNIGNDSANFIASRDRVEEKRGRQTKQST